MKRGGRSVAGNAKQVYDLVFYFKEKHPARLGCYEIAQVFNFHIRTAQRTLQAYELAGWLKGDSETPKGYRLSFEACQLLMLDPSKDPLKGLVSTTPTPREGHQKYKGIVI